MDGALPSRLASAKSEVVQPKTLFKRISLIFCAWVRSHRIVSYRRGRIGLPPPDRETPPAASAGSDQCRSYERRPLFAPHPRDAGQIPDADRLPAHAMACERGYCGGPSRFRAIIACHRPRPKAETYLRLRTPPGEQAHYAGNRTMLLRTQRFPRQPEDLGGLGRHRLALSNLGRRSKCNLIAQDFGCWRRSPGPLAAFLDQFARLLDGQRFERRGLGQPIRTAARFSRLFGRGPLQQWDGCWFSFVSLRSAAPHQYSVPQRRSNRRLRPTGAICRTSWGCPPRRHCNIARLPRLSYPDILDLDRSI
jgi:hypothetical protein